MARFNFLFRSRNKMINRAGGDAFTQSPQLELVSLLLTSFANEQYYRSSNDTFARIKELAERNDKLFAAKAAVYARTKFGMRSITHVLAAELAPHLSGTAWARDFYNAVIHRPDDMMEIMACYAARYGRPTNAMKKGFAKAFDKFGGYQLGKYRGERRDFSLVDIVNLVHPVPTLKNAAALTALVKDELRSVDTWESRLTKAGQAAGSEEEKAAFKRDVWVQLIRERKLGYFALLRNLRNILEQAPDVLGEALEMLTDERLVRRSLVLPFRFLTAYEEVKTLAGTEGTRETLVALSRATDLALDNVPRFRGKTLVALDVSGSMEGRPAAIGSLFSAILAKACNADLLQFSDHARYVAVNPADSTLTIAESIRFASGGTDFHSIFRKCNKAYDRIVVLSDMQGWIGQHTPVKTFEDYRRRTGANPHLYSFDLNGYGNMQFPQNKVYCLAGFSDKVFDIMSLLETDRDALVREINKISFV